MNKNINGINRFQFKILSHEHVHQAALLISELFPAYDPENAFLNISRESHYKMIKEYLSEERFFKYSVIILDKLNNDEVIGTYCCRPVKDDELDSEYPLEEKYYRIVANRNENDPTRYYLYFSKNSKIESNSKMWSFLRKSAVEELKRLKVYNSSFYADYACVSQKLANLNLFGRALQKAHALMASYGYTNQCALLINTAAIKLASHLKTTILFNFKLRIFEEDSIDEYQNNISLGNDSMNSSKHKLMLKETIVEQNCLNINGRAVMIDLKKAKF